MRLRVQRDCTNIDFNNISEMLKEVGMAYYAQEVHKRAFENSKTVIFIFDDDRLVGFGRAISDGAYQAAIYDVAVLPMYQGKGIGKLIVDSIVKDNTQCNFILYTAPGKEGFYEKIGFRKMKTGMALFQSAESMQLRGFTE